MYYLSITYTCILYTQLHLSLEYLYILHSIFIYHSLDAVLIEMYFKTHYARSVHLLTTFVLSRCTDPL